MCLGGLRRSLGATVVKILIFCWMVQKVSGKVQEGPRSPPGPLKNYLFFIKMSFVVNTFFNCLLYCLLDLLSSISSVNTIYPFMLT